MTSDHFSRRSLLRAGAIGLGALAIGGVSMAPAWAAYQSDVFLIKTNYTPSGKIEILTATVNTRYQGSQRFVTWISASEKYNGVFQMVGVDLYFIKTRNTASGSVEIYNATRASNYRSASVQARTLFKTWDSGNGTFQMEGGDLYFIKNKNCGTGRIEVYSATRRSNFKSFGVKTHTLFTLRDANRGVWQMYRKDVFFIKTKYTGTGRIEVFSATAKSNYSRVGVSESTLIKLADQNNGWFQLVGTDLYFIKNKRTSSGKIEVYSATRASKYKSLGVSARTWMSTANGGDGWFVAIDPRYNSTDKVVPTATVIPPKPTVAPTSKPPTLVPSTAGTVAPNPTTKPPTLKPSTARPPTTAPTTAPTTTNSPTTRPPTTSPAPTGPTTTSVANALLAKIQNYRASQGVARLGWNARLTSVAKSWSDSMARSNRLAHNPYLDSQVPAGWSSLGENVAYTTVQGTTDRVAQTLFTSWVASPAHRANMLASKYNSSGLGVGRASNGTWYATHNLARY